MPGILEEVEAERSRLDSFAEAGLSADAPCTPKPIMLIDCAGGGFLIRFACIVCGSVAGETHEATLDNKAAMLAAMDAATSSFSRAAVEGCPKLAAG